MVSDLELTWRSQGHIAFFYLTEMIDIFIDYAWIYWQLYFLFVGVDIPDQNFKGDASRRLNTHEEIHITSGIL